MATPYSEILSQTEQYLTDFFQKKISAEYVFHDFNHTQGVLEAVIELGTGNNLDERELQLLQLAAWFHDSGYDQGPEGHEERSCRYAVGFLSKFDLPDQDLDLITRCIMATRLPFKPKDLLEEIMCDADLSHLGKQSYWDRTGRLRQELLLTRGKMMTEQDWVQFELDFMNNHRYFTTIAEELYNPRKLKHIKQLRKQEFRLNPAGVASVDDLARKDKGKKGLTKLEAKAAKKELQLRESEIGRGVETMYRTTYRTHINLSGMADSKANIMLSVNAIVISVSIPQFLSRMEEHPHIIVPAILLLVVCITAMVLATLSTRPKITEGKITKEAIEAKTANLLFFGNFHNMRLDEYHWGMMQMIRDKEFLYTAMTKDLYFLGVVLAKKYRYLTYCYNVFMYGMIAVVLIFVVTFLV
ncbi:MAG: HD family phosphohydrolase [Bacteroidetes bacterium]|nr:HD family phosphohydrolase [Bacteroidota bacterium]